MSGELATQVMVKWGEHEKEGGGGENVGPFVL